MRTIEEAILFALLEENEAEASRLAASMLPGELFRFGEALEQTQVLINRHIEEKTHQRHGAEVENRT